jgi:hypothetical protein
MGFLRAHRRRLLRDGGGGAAALGMGGLADDAGRLRLVDWRSNASGARMAIEGCLSEDVYARKSAFSRQRGGDGSRSSSCRPWWGSPRVRGTQVARCVVGAGRVDSRRSAGKMRRMGGLRASRLSDNGCHSQGQMPSAILSLTSVVFWVDEPPASPPIEQANADFRS